MGTLCELDGLIVNLSHNTQLKKLLNASLGHLNIPKAYSNSPQDIIHRIFFLSIILHLILFFPRGLEPYLEESTTFYLLTLLIAY